MADQAERWHALRDNVSQAISRIDELLGSGAEERGFSLEFDTPIGGVEQVKVGGATRFAFEAPVTRITATPSFVEPGSAQVVVAQALRTALEAISFLADTAVGECRQAVPYAPTRDVIDKDGVAHLCCTHPVEHCVP